MDRPRFLKQVEEANPDAKFVEAAEALVSALATTFPKAFEASAKKYRTLASELAQAAVPPAVAPAPAAVLGALDDLREESLKVLDAFHALRLLLISRSPAMKEEDNAGVAIQHAFAELLDGYIDALGGIGGKKDSTGISLAPISLRKEYVSARSTAEEKVHKSTCSCGASCQCGKDGKDCGCNMSKETATSPAVLHQVDIDAALKVSVAFLRLQEACLQVGLGFARNAAKLLTPRAGGNSMVG